MRGQERDRTNRTCARTHAVCSPRYAVKTYSFPSAKAIGLLTAQGNVGKWYVFLVPTFIYILLHEPGTFRYNVKLSCGGQGACEINATRRAAIRFLPHPRPLDGATSKLARARHGD